jgi:hypothetical protein
MPATRNAVLDRRLCSITLEPCIEDGRGARDSDDDMAQRVFAIGDAGAVASYLAHGAGVSGGDRVGGQ